MKGCNEEDQGDIGAEDEADIEASVEVPRSSFEALRVSLLMNGTHVDGECTLLLYDRPNFGAPEPAGCRAKPGATCKLR